MASKKQRSKSVGGMMISCLVCDFACALREIGHHIQEGETQTEGTRPRLMIKCGECRAQYPLKKIHRLVTKSSPEAGSDRLEGKDANDQDGNGLIVQKRKSSKAKASVTASQSSGKRSATDTAAEAVPVKKQRKLPSTYEQADSQAAPALPRGQVQSNRVRTEAIRASGYSSGPWKKDQMQVAEKFAALYMTDPHRAYECFVEEMKQLCEVAVWKGRSEPVFNAYMAKFSVETPPEPRRAIPTPASDFDASSGSENESDEE